MRLDLSTLVGLLPCVAGLGLLIAVLLLWNRCSECGSLKTRRIGLLEIPGTERKDRQLQYIDEQGQVFTSADLFAKYWVFLRCRRCGHEWVRIKRGRVDKTSFEGLSSLSLTPDSGADDEVTAESLGELRQQLIAGLKRRGFEPSQGSSRLLCHPSNPTARFVIFKTVARLEGKTFLPQSGGWRRIASFSIRKQSPLALQVAELLLRSK
jgi:hypothetical protein